MAFSQVSTQMQTRIRQSIAIYDKKIAEIQFRISNLESAILVYQSYIPQAIAFQEIAYSSYSNGGR